MSYYCLELVVLEYAHTLVYLSQARFLMQDRLEVLDNKLHLHVLIRKVLFARVAGLHFKAPLGDKDHFLAEGAKLDLIVLAEFIHRLFSKHSFHVVEAIAYHHQWDVFFDC